MCVCTGRRTIHWQKINCAVVDDWLGRSLLLHKNRFLSLVLPNLNRSG